MRKFLFVGVILFFALSFGVSCVKAKEDTVQAGAASQAQLTQQVKEAVKEAIQEQAAGSTALPATAAVPVVQKPKLVLLIAEQNIEGPQRAWWASEIDLSTVEAIIAKNLIAQGYEVLEPSNLTDVIRQDKAFRLLSISDGDSIKLGSLSKADYVVLGKAVASAGGLVPQSTMRSCFANVTAKLIRVKDGKVLAYLDASGNSAHPDVVSGGREALSYAGEDLSAKIVAELNKEGGN
jgi:hypothetical protein